MKHNFIKKDRKKNVGRVGEAIICRYLEEKGYEIVVRNYLKKWGEIDVIAEYGGVIHFVEVKTVSRENIFEIGDNYEPEENVHPEKLKRMLRTIQSYLLEKRVGDDVLWQIDVAGVFVDLDGKKARVRFTENVVI